MNDISKLTQKEFREYCTHKKIARGPIHVGGLFGMDKDHPEGFTWGAYPGVDRKDTPEMKEMRATLSAAIKRRYEREEKLRTKYPELSDEEIHLKMQNNAE